jgi:hypothetical protein
MTEITPRAGEQLSRTYLALAIAGAAAFLYLRTFLLPATPVIAHDDQTIFFARAVNILHGQILYRDFFEFVPPGTDLLYAAGFRLFGVHAWLLQSWSIALGLALFCLVTQLASRILRGPVILLPGLLFLVFDFAPAMVPTHHWYSTLAALAAVSALSGGSTSWRIVVAGLLCGIATLFTQTQGALVFTALLLYLVWFNWSQSASLSQSENARILPDFAAFILPYLLVLSSVLGYYVHKAGFHTLFFDLIVFPLRYLSSGDFNSPRAYLRQFPPLHSFASIASLIPYLFIYALVPYIYFIGAYRLWRRRSDLHFSQLRQMILLHLVGLALFLAVATGPRFYRLCTVAAPAVLICVWLLDGEGPIHRFLRWLLFALAAVLALLLPLYRQAQHHAILDLPIGRTAFSDPEEFREFQWLAQRTHPAEPFFNNSALTLYLSLNNLTPVEFVMDGEFTRPAQVAAVLRALEQHPPHFIALDASSDNTPASESSNAHDHSAPFRQYIQQHYSLVRTFALDHNSRPEEIWELKP